jgi:UDP-N-acetyl-2-amino-2-deoxyglucuronate dehydrogenase
MTPAVAPPRPVKVVIIGSGVAATAHARVAVAHPGLQLVGIVETERGASGAGTKPSLADYVEETLKGDRPATFSTLDAALAGLDVDLVAVCTPSGTHADIAEQAISAGTHVVIEKPIDVDLVRARRLSSLALEARAQGVVVSVISQHRFDPANAAIARAISAGRFGQITSATATVAWWRDEQYYDSSDWRGSWRLDGGALLNQGVQTIDLLVHFLGTPVEVFGRTARLAHSGIEAEDVGGALITFENGAIATLLATTNAHPHVGARVQVHGSAGSAISNRDQLEYFFAADAHPAGSSRYRYANQALNEVSANDVPGGFDDRELFHGHLRQYEDIIEAIETGREPGVTVTDAVTVLALVRAVYVSQTLGLPVAFADVIGGRYDDVVAMTGPSQPGSTQSLTTDPEAAA